MATVNIRRDVKDAFYRYKMPKLQSKVEGKGNGIKTVISNMEEISKSLNRPPSYVTKYFGAEVGAQVICDVTNSRYIVNGIHDAEKLAVILDGFIVKFVLCPGCENPETKLTVKNGLVDRVCKACGQKHSVDMNHKIVSYIIKNPPPKQPKTNMVVPDKKEENIENSVEQMDDLFDSFEIEETQKTEVGTEVYDEFANFVSKSSGLDILDKMDDLALDPSKAAAIYVQVKYAKDFGSMDNDDLLLRFASNGEKVQLAILGSIERIVGSDSALQKNYQLFSSLFTTKI